MMKNVTYVLYILFSSWWILFHASVLVAQCTVAKIASCAAS